MKALLFIGLFMPVIAAAQVTGYLRDDKGAALSSVTVSLQRLADSSSISTVLSDSSGRFFFKQPAPGNYVVRATRVGFEPLWSAPFAIDGSSKDLGSLVFLPQRKQLQEVTVMGSRPTFVQQADRLVVTVDGTALAAGNSVLNVLSRMPGVLVDAEGNIQLNGRPGVTVMIDGRPTYLSARDLRNLLEGMPAENLRNIEVIANPPARFEAEGTAGILNLNLKKPTVQGTSGSIYTGYNTNGIQNGWSAGANLNYRRGRWTAFGSADLARRVGGRNGIATRYFAGASPIYFDQTLLGNFVSDPLPSLRIGADYALSRKHTIGFSASSMQRASEEEFFTSTTISDARGVPVLRAGAANYTDNRFDSKSFNAHWVGKPDSAGSVISADLDLVRIRNDRNGAFYNSFDSSNGVHREEQQFTATPTSGYDILSGRFDYTRVRAGGHKLETGFKVSDVRTDDDAGFYLGAARIPDAYRSNHFRYTERILAGYLSWSGPIGPKSTLQAGLRAEHTAATGEQLITGAVNSRGYLDLFPTLFLQQEVSERYSLSFSYGRRVTRPNYAFLNPFRFYRDPYTWVEGNPALVPQYSHLVNFTQTFRKTYLATLWYKETKNVMYETPVIYADSAYSSYTFANVGTEYEAGLTLVLPIKVTRWWDMRNNFVFEWDRIDATYKSTQSNQNFYYDLQSTHTMQLPAALRLELNAHYQGPTIMGIYLGEPWFRLDGGLKRSFLKKKLDLSLNVSDIFRSHQIRSTAFMNGSRSSFDQYLRFRSASITLRYNFSKGLKVEEQRRRSVEELNRAGG
jgi:hypothetical protein